MENPKINPYIPIFIGVISVSLSAIFVKLANAEAGIIAFYRMLFSVLIMAPCFFGNTQKSYDNYQKEIGYSHLLRVFS